MTAWERCWLDGFSKVIPADGLERLRAALATDDHRLAQGVTTAPPPMVCVQDWPCEGACAVAICGMSDGATVGDVNELFGAWCFEADQLLGEPGACRYFLNWFDDTPREEMRRQLLPMVEAAIADRVHPGSAGTAATAVSGAG